MYAYTKEVILLKMLFLLRKTVLSSIDGLCCSRSLQTCMLYILVINNSIAFDGICLNFCVYNHDLTEA